MKKILVILICFLIYANTVQKIDKSEFRTKHTAALSQSKVQVDVRVARLEVFFKRFGSPFVTYSEFFIQEADENKIDWKLLPVVSCVESSCGKYYQLNAFGWGSDSIDFGSDADDIRAIDSKIATLSYYSIYRKSGRLYDFALAYNHDHANEYVQKLEYFYEKL